MTDYVLHGETGVFNSKGQNLGVQDCPFCHRTDGTHDESVAHDAPPPPATPTSAQE